MEVLNTQLLQLGESSGEVLLPALSVLGVQVHPTGHLIVGKQCHISGQHDDAGLILSRVNLETVSLSSLLPLHIDQVLVESVVEIQSGCGPGPNEA